MTGKLTVGTIQDTAGTTIASTFVTGGVAKAWLRYNHDTPAVLDSFNISSVDDAATGKYRPNFTNNMNSTTNYATAVTGQAEANYNHNCNYSEQEATSSTLVTTVENAGVIDRANNSFSIPGGVLA